MAPAGHSPYKYLLPSLLLLPHTPPQAQAVRHHQSSEEGKERKQHPQSRSRALLQLQPADHHKTVARTYVMSRGRRGGTTGRGLDLKLHLSPPAPVLRASSSSSSSSSDEDWSSSPSSCLSSEGEREPPPQGQGHGLQWSDSPGATSMVLAACPRCLMYVMLSEADPRCPRCRSPVLLDFLHHAAAAARNNSSAINVNGGGRDDDDHSRNSIRGGGGRNRRA